MKKPKYSEASTFGNIKANFDSRIYQTKHFATVLVHMLHRSSLMQVKKINT